MDRVSLGIILIATGLKILLFPAYRSTDFEVHRNWLAITYSKPWQEWYTDGASASEWTLDYPPFFAWMEHGLAHIARYFDPEMLEVTNLDYASKETIRFQRLSVVFTEFLLLVAVAWVTHRWPVARRRLALFLVAASPGIIIVDHIHFQYNGVLLGIFVLSIWACAGGKEILGGALFAALLCFKHIFLYPAPAFFVFLLRHYCRRDQKTFSMARFFALGLTVLSVIGIALGPFLNAGLGPHLARRMFPVSRGLMHAYWAPNFWALYAAADKVLQIVLPRAGVPLLAQYVRPTNAATLTGGLVGEAPFAVLPNVSSGMTILCVLCAMAPCLVATWRRPLPGRFARAATVATLTAFIFGYHVHEKAILMTLVPLGLLAAGGTDKDAPKEFAFLSIVGTYSLFPLLIRKEEYGIKVALLIVYLLIALPWLKDPEYWAVVGRWLEEATRETESGAAVSVEAEEERTNSSGKKENNTSGGKKEKNTSGNVTGGTRMSQGKAADDGAPSSSGTIGGTISNPLQKRKTSSQSRLFCPVEAAYLWGIVPLELYCLIGHRLIFGTSRLPFLPLLLTSVYCSGGVVYCWGRMMWRYCKEVLQNGGKKGGSGSTSTSKPKQGGNSVNPSASVVSTKGASGSMGYTGSQHGRLRESTAGEAEVRSRKRT